MSDFVELIGKQSHMPGDGSTGADLEVVRVRAKHEQIQSRQGHRIVPAIF